MPAAQQDAQLEALRLQEQARPFDFERGPLLRVSLLRLSDAQHYPLLTLSALIADARALANIFDELARLTSATDADQNGVAPLQYADFAEWHNQLLESDEAAPGRAFWQTRQLPTAFVLPLAAPNTARATNHTPEVLLTRLETELSAGIRREAHARGASEEEFAHSRLRLLACHAAPAPPLVAVLSDGRDDPELASALGRYARLVPVSLAPTPTEHFTELLAKTAGTLAEYVVGKNILP